MNAARIIWRALKMRAAEGSALIITENRRRQLAEVFVNANNLLAFPKIALFGISPRFAAMSGLSKKSECENCFNKKALKYFRREKNAAEPTRASANGGCLSNHDFSQRLCARKV